MSSWRSLCYLKAITVPRFLPALLSVLAAACGSTHAPAVPVSEHQSSVPSPSGQLAKTSKSVDLLTIDQARHLLNRATFGPHTSDIQTLQKVPFSAWLDEQLSPPLDEDDERLRLALEPYKNSTLSPSQLIAHYQKTGPEPLAPPRLIRTKKSTVNYRQLLLDMQMHQLTRQLLSKYQLREVMTDFWANHFNVYARKSDVKLVVNSYINQAIRPRALGRFDRLLIATAKHPAMLIYLDNATSVKEQKTKTGRRGPNENYARELLELHTLSVHGGYDQSDVKEAARAFTGWGVESLPRSEFTYIFRPQVHDNGTKVVLNRAYKQRGEEEGLDLLRALARHPKTAQHLAYKLCQRFVADEAPPSCVDDVTKSYLKNEGEMTEVLRTLFSHPTFWKDSTRSGKFKTPLQFAISAARAVNGAPDGGTNFARQLAELGQDPYMQAIPTGYSDLATAWNNSAGLLSRFRFSALFSAQSDVGIVFDFPPAIAQEGDPVLLVRKLGAQLLSQGTSEQTLSAITAEVASLNGQAEQRRLALSLLLSSPEFQQR